MFSKVIAPSRRSCPLCGSEAHYVQNFLGRLTGFSTRKCTSCSYVDPAKVKFYPRAESSQA
jgi:uncharacterized Zn finger protein